LFRISDLRTLKLFSISAMVRQARPTGHPGGLTMTLQYNLPYTSYLPYKSQIKPHEKTLS